MSILLDGALVPSCVFEVACDQFVRGFAAAAVWSGTVLTPDEEPVAVDEGCGLAAETYTTALENRIAADDEVIKDCAQFMALHWADLNGLIESGECPNWEHHGHDFLLTRDHHGAGFWDRGYEETGDRLTDAAQTWSENCFDFWLEMDGDVLTGVDYEYH